MSFWDQFKTPPSAAPKATHDYAITTEQASRVAPGGLEILSILQDEPCVIVRMRMTLAEVRTFFGDASILEVLDVPSTEL